MRSVVLRVCAGCSIFALALLSWLPAQDMARTGVLSGSQEHFLAYMISGLLVVAAMPRYRFVHVACFYVLLAAILELGQIFAPGRDAEAFTVLVSMSGAVVGEIVARIVTGVWREKYGFPLPLTATIPGTTPAAPVLKREPPAGPQWIHEVKFDGWRMQLQRPATESVNFAEPIVTVEPV